MNRGVSGGARPFCDADPAAVLCFDAWVRRLEEAGVELGEADRYIVGVVASREARLEQLAAAVSSAVDGTLQLQLVGAERLAAQDVARGLDLLERTFGVQAEGVREPVKVAASGPGDAGGRVVAFTAGSSKTRPKTKAGQRIAAVVNAGHGLKLPELRRSVPGSQGAFRAGLREAVALGAIRREGQGTRGRPFVYLPGGRA